ncbi:hypothetical protein J3F83DRAFT_748354, partial [Trichoderma novae-zelandiae]
MASLVFVFSFLSSLAIYLGLGGWTRRNSLLAWLTCFRLCFLLSVWFGYVSGL